MNGNTVGMKHEHRLTAKGQVTIPKDIRDALGLEPGHRVSFLRGDDGKVQIVKADDAAEQKAWLAQLTIAQNKYGSRDLFMEMDGLEYQHWIRPDRIDV